MADRLITLSIMFGSIIYLVEARQLTFGSIGSPKSGFLPVVAGTVALLLSIATFISQLRSEERDSSEPCDWTKFIFVIIGLFAYVVILVSLGYFAATLILLIYLFKVADTAGWLTPLLIASSGSIAFYLLFVRYLEIPLP